MLTRLLKSVRYPDMADRFNELHRQRGDLDLQGRVREMIPVQLGIVAETEKTGRVRDLANAWNYLSALYHRVREYDRAEQAARKALEVYAGDPSPSAESLGCYQFKLAQILAAQGRFAEAVAFAEAGVRSYGVFHDPPDDFLKARQEEAALMRDFMQRAAGAAESRDGRMPE
ncbi:MAG TPA: tetratricopeptide repeat protein [Tepidisphaeraceae bacterium]|nr:tetratricopeptide repeat protein [Tepidisphaeraceae bacterium]